MFSRIFKRQARRTSPPSVPAGLRLYAIGDIHGRADLLARLHVMIQDDASSHSEAARKAVVYLGDYIDRGLESRGVVELLLDAPLRGFEVAHLKGNHEDVLLQFMDDAAIGPNWFAMGGDATALSYGVQIPSGLSWTERFEHVREALIDRMPERHSEFFANLDLMYRAEDYVLVHAGIRPGVPLDEQDPNDLLWIRDQFLTANDGGGKVIVHGHSLSTQPEILEHRIGIDTGAYATNVLTCLVLEGTEQRFLSTPAMRSTN